MNKFIFNDNSHKTHIHIHESCLFVSEVGGVQENICTRPIENKNASYKTKEYNTIYNCLYIFLKTGCFYYIYTPCFGGLIMIMNIGCLVLFLSRNNFMDCYYRTRNYLLRVPGVTRLSIGSMEHGK